MRIENKKRRTLKAVAVAGTGLVLTDVWKKPLINSVLLPAHAQTSASDTTPPVGGNATVSANSDGVATGSLIASDDTDTNPTVMIVSQASSGSVSLSGLNFTYTASAGAGFTGSDSFTYKVRDASNNESAVFTITINSATPVDNAPTGADATFEADLSGIAVIELVANDDIDASPNIVLVTQPANGTLNPVVGKRTRYTSTQASSFKSDESDTFTYKVVDSSGSESPIYTITVVGTNCPRPFPLPTQNPTLTFARRSVSFSVQVPEICRADGTVLNNNLLLIINALTFNDNQVRMQVVGIREGESSGSVLSTFEAFGRISSTVTRTIQYRASPRFGNVSLVVTATRLPSRDIGITINGSVIGS